MGVALQCEPPRLTEAQLESLRRQLCEAAGHMSDEQILGLADGLHAELRVRRDLRCRIHDRVEHRLCHEGDPPPPA